MTSEAPEKIWALVEPDWEDGEDGPFLGGTWDGGEYRDGEPYIHEPAAQAMVAAAYEAAAKNHDRHAEGYSRVCQAADRAAHEEHARAIRAMISDDARAALGAMLAEEREKALREACNNLRAYAPHEGQDTGPEHDVGYARGYQTAMNRILALIDKPADPGAL